MQFWSAEVTTAAPMTLTLDEGADSVYLYKVHVRNYTGSTLVQYRSGASAVSTALSPPSGTMTLSAAPAATSEVLAARVHNASSGTTTSATPGAGWTEVFDSDPFPGVSGLESQVRSNSTSPTVAWTNINDTNIGAEQLIGVALEIKAAGGVTNGPLVIVTPAAQVSALGAAVNLAVSASDPNGDSLTGSVPPGYQPVCRSIPPPLASSPARSRQPAHSIRLSEPPIQGGSVRNGDIRLDGQQRASQSQPDHRDAGGAKLGGRFCHLAQHVSFRSRWR